MPKPTILIVPLLILLSGILHAETIKQRPYSFRYDDGAEGLPDQTYLLCSNCQDDKPTIIPCLVAHSSVDNVCPQGVLPSIDKGLMNRSEKPSSLVRPIAVAEKVHFAFASAALLPETTAILDRLETDKPLHLKGYTCTIGTEGYNMELSQKRADAVSLYLKKRGISILSAKGFGKSTRYTDKSLNRRVEIIETKENNGS